MQIDLSETDLPFLQKKDKQAIHPVSLDIQHVQSWEGRFEKTDP